MQRGLSLALLVCCLQGEIGTCQPGNKVFDLASPTVLVVQRLDRSTQGSSVVVYRDTSSLSTTVTIATNCHVVGNANEVSISRYGRSVNATVVHRDTKRDLCLLLGNVDLPAAVLRAATTLKVGEKVYSIGAPRGLELSISEGIVGQLRREKTDSAPLIQTTAPISPGSSGGGLFDSFGKMVGLTTSTSRNSQNLNFAIPSEWILEALEITKAKLGKVTTSGSGGSVEKACGWDAFGRYDGGTYYLDACEIRTQGNRTFAWVLASLDDDVNSSEKKSTKTRLLIDCAIERWALISVINYTGRMGSGDILTTYSKPETEWSFADIVPRSVAASVAAKSCAGKP